jgi:hypothetical protein
VPSAAGEQPGAHLGKHLLRVPPTRSPAAPTEQLAAVDLPLFEAGFSMAETPEWEPVLHASTIGDERAASNITQTRAGHDRLRAYSLVNVSSWIVVVVVVWALCWLLCWRMGIETGRNGVLFGVFGPLGVVLLALLPWRKEPSRAVARLQQRGVLGLRVRRDTLTMGGDGNLEHWMGGWRRQIREDVTEGDSAADDPS